MRDNAEKTLTPDEAFGVLDRLCRDYVISDLQLLSKSLDCLATPGLFGIPVIHTSPKFEVNLTFNSWVGEDKKILFGLIKRKRSERVAELDIKLQLTPAWEISVSEVHRVEVYGTWPRFFKDPAANKNVMTIILAGEKPLPMRLPGDGGADADLTWRPELMGPMMLTLAEWVRDGNRSAPAPQNIGSGGTLDHLLETLVTGTDTLLSDTAAVLSSDGAMDKSKKTDANFKRQLSVYRERIASKLGPEFTGYRFTDLSSRLKLVLDENGKLAEDPFSGSTQRYDLQARLETGPSHPRVVCTLKVPDLLVSGPLYDHILTVLTHSKGLEELNRALGEALAAKHLPSQDALIAYIQAARKSQRAVIARIERARSGEDMDFILLEGSLAERESWLLLCATISFQEREAGAGALRIDQFKDVDLIAWRIGDGDWTPGKEKHEKAKGYFYRAFLSLHSWRMRFGPRKEV